MATIIDVCKLAGVSKTTVSRVINGTGKVKESTRKSIHDAMELLGYRPNSMAQALAGNLTNSFGLVLSNFQGEHFNALIKQASVSTNRMKKELIITDGHNNCKQEYEAILRLEDRRCDAIILYSRKITIQQLTQLKVQLSVPLVLINNEFEQDLFHTVTFDYSGAINMMMNHLASFGHRKIACITGSLDTPSNQLLFSSYQAALKQYAIPFNSHLSKSTNDSLQGGYDACKELINSRLPFSALVACNDEMAVGALKALSEAGIRVPEQVSIAGIGCSPMTRFSNPSISTIEVPIAEMTKQAIDLAFKLASNKQCSLIHQHKGKLIQRESIMPFNSDKKWLTY